jgi:hypothetical protein
MPPDIVVSAGPIIVRETLTARPAIFREANILNVRTLLALALILPFLGMTLSAQAAKMDARAARAECFRQAQAAVDTIGFSPTTADMNAEGLDAYRQCCYKMGIRP